MAILLTAGLVLTVLLAVSAWWLIRRLTEQLLGTLRRLESAEAEMARGELPPILVPSHPPELPPIVYSQQSPRHVRKGEAEKPSLLYICPVVPGNTGSGLAIRAGMILRLLADRYRVWLLSMPVYTNGYPLPVPFADLCEEWAVLPYDDDRGLMLTPWEDLPAPPGNDTPVYGNMTFDVVHVFRLYSLPAARFYFSAGEVLQLDLDDVESKTHGRHAEFRIQQGEEEAAENEFVIAGYYRELEDESFDFFDRIFVCSERDRLDLIQRTSRPVCVLPNGVPIPPVRKRSHQEGPYRFFFIGSLGYFPNHRGAMFFCTEVMPLIRARTDREFIFTVAGTGGSWFADEVAHLPDVEVQGWVLDVADCYHAADAVVAPIPSGGGTRVKVLEAFSYRRPVVSTTIGAEGIEVRDGEEILIGDTAEEFATQCLRLMEDEALGRHLVENAFRLLQSNYSLEALGRQLDACSDLAATGSAVDNGSRVASANQPRT